MNNIGPPVDETVTWLDHLVGQTVTSHDLRLVHGEFRESEHLRFANSVLKRLVDYQVIDPVLSKTTGKQKRRRVLDSQDKPQASPLWYVRPKHRRSSKRVEICPVCYAVHDWRHPRRAYIEAEQKHAPAPPAPSHDSAPSSPAQ